MAVWRRGSQQLPRARTGAGGSPLGRRGLGPVFAGLAHEPAGHRSGGGSDPADAQTRCAARQRARWLLATGGRAGGEMADQPAGTQPGGLSVGHDAGRRGLRRPAGEPDRRHPGPGRILVRRRREGRVPFDEQRLVVQLRPVAAGRSGKHPLGGHRRGRVEPRDAGDLRHRRGNARSGGAVGLAGRGGRGVDRLQRDRPRRVRRGALEGRRSAALRTPRRAVQFLGQRGVRGCRPAGLGGDMGRPVPVRRRPLQRGAARRSGRAPDLRALPGPAGPPVVGHPERPGPSRRRGLEDVCGAGGVDGRRRPGDRRRRGGRTLGGDHGRWVEPVPGRALQCPASP